MGSFEMRTMACHPRLPGTSCGYLLQELKLIWDEVGQEQVEREKVLRELEEECLDVYRRKVDSANIHRAHLHQALADSEAQYTHLLVSLGEPSYPGRPGKLTGTLKEQLESITPALQEMKLRKEERLNRFREVQVQIQRISAEIAGQSDQKISLTDVEVNEDDISLKKLEEYHQQLHQLHNEKTDRLLKVEAYRTVVHELAATMGMDSSRIISNIYPNQEDSSGLYSGNISGTVLGKLNSAVESLKEEKQNRLDKLNRLANTLSKLWNILDTPSEERKSFLHIMDFITASAADTVSPGSLTHEIIQQAENEVKRLDQLKASKMKELFLRKQTELEDICRRSRMEIPIKTEIETIMNRISSDIDHTELLRSMERQIIRAKEEASSRKDIMEKVEKWMALCSEERWLEEYNRDENRYTISRGAHKNLKRAERARIMVNKIPALVDLLVTKISAREKEEKKVFFYDEVPLLAMLEEYNFLRQEKEEDKQRQKEKKKKEQNQLVASQENLSGSRKSPSKNHYSTRSLNGSFSNTIPLTRDVPIAIQHSASNKFSAYHRLRFITENKKIMRQEF